MKWVRFYARGLLIKTHPRKPPGGQAIDASDYPVERSVYAMRNVEALQHQAEAAGEVIGRYAAALLDSPLPWTRMRRVYALLGLVRRYGAARVTEVCTIALAADMLDIHRLKRMLEHGVAAAPPPPPARVMPPGRYLRPASQYQLPFRSAFEGRGVSMTTTDVISPDLKTILRRLKLSRMLDTLPERLTLARQQKMPHQDLLLQVLSDEVARRDSLAITLRVQKARLDPTMRLDAWDTSAKVTFDRALLNELTALRFLDAHADITIVGPVGVGKTFLAHALGHIACRRGATVLAARTDQMLKTLKHARLDNSYEAELRKLVAVDLLILDDFAIDVLDPVESRDLYDLLLERYRTGSVIVTSNRGPDEWLATFADPVRAQSAIDRFTSNAYDFVIEGESYRPRLKPRLAKEGKERSR